MATPRIDRTQLQEQIAILQETETRLAAAGMDAAGLAGLRSQIAALQAELGGGPAAAAQPTQRGDRVFGDKVAGDKIAGHKILATLQDGSVLIGGDAQGLIVITGDGNQVTLAADLVPPDALLAAYRRSLADECCRLPLGVIDVEFVHAGGEQPVPLPDIYVDLDVVTPAAKDDQGERGWALRLLRGEGDQRTPLLAALARPQQRLAVLLGDAGSGKTTFVNYLAHLLNAEVAPARDSLPAELRELLAVRLVLREVAAQSIPSQARQGTAQMLWDALHRDMAGRLGQAGADRLLPHVQARLLRQGGLLLLDGLDEVPAARGRRKLLLEAVRALAGELPPTGGHILVTARPYAYADRRWQLPGFSTLALAPFSQEQATRFVDRWHQAVRPAMQWNEETARAKASALRAALADRPYLGDLASRPLLLTLMATLHSSWGQLPEDRAGLYEETVKLLLSRWQRAREARGPDGEPVMEPGIAEALGVGDARIRTCLEALAYAVHARQRRQPEQREGPADITEGEVLVAFKPLLGQVAPDTLLRYLQERAGLLVERRDQTYAFPYRSFQEYLAACHLADHADFAERLQRLAGEDPAWWRDVFLLGVGKAKQGGPGSAINVVNVALPDEPADVAAPTESHWRLAELAGAALVELRLPPGSQGHVAAVLRRTQRWLAALVAGGHLPARERLAAGDALGKLGDPRPGVGVTVLKVQGLDLALPDLRWAEVPAGPFTMGSGPDDEDAYSDERHAHPVTLPAFYVACHPVTNAQFRPFVESDGYGNPAYWTEAGWAWRQGADADLSPIDDENLKRDYQRWLANRPAAKRDRPHWWDDLGWVMAANRSVVGITWHEAMAYARWLDARLRQTGSRLHLLDGRTLALPPGYAVRLPSEAEWEKAARGADGRRYPWGPDWQAGAANGEETGLEQTSPVGLFPAGAGPYGAHDMAGNVWEWTATRWGRTSIYRPDYAYPYDAKDGREDPGDPDLRILRGGSWYNEAKWLRCAFRSRSIPGFFNVNDGVRVVVSLAAPGF